ncbi:MAG: N-acetylgalactosamine 6-sulfate sulfatase [Acidobacteria bacterium]|nr:MAG: N-acetylgalactosamine 6-sulfate sulfatase [Acidobacteriota bacterium]
MADPRPSRREFLQNASCVALAVGPFRAQAPGVRKPPNIVVILTDDQGWGDLRLNGNRNLQTPRIDSLAHDGAQFDRFLVCPVCAPTRAELLTGRYHPRGGVHGVTTGAERLNLDEKTLGDAFKAAGYATGCFGKWHNGTQYPYHPNARGFDEFYGFCSGHWGQYFDPVLENNGQIVRGKGYIADDLTEHALSFIEQNQGRPFFCYLAYNTPHSPFQVPDRFYDKFKNSPVEMRHQDPDKEELDKTRCVLAMCENLDWNVGRVLDQLDQLTIADDTIVIYFSDNGPNSWRWNGGMKGRKASTDEGGLRVPFLIRWPGRIQAGKRVPQIAGAIDLLPTLASLSAIPVVSRKPLDGTNLEPLLVGSPENWPDRMLFSHWNGRVSVRTQRYRLDQAGSLYDMQADPGQERDISGEKPEIAAQLTKAVARWKEEVLPKTKDDRPFLVGHPDFRVAYLPARDGVPSGGVRRSASAPNCSYFTNWVSDADKISWDTEVLTTGDYEATIYYTCPKDSVGSKAELRFTGRFTGDSVQAVVAEPHDPPLVGAQFDRASRGGESYVKDFKPLRLGVLRLKKGRGELTLRALVVPGRMVADVRAVVLTLVSSGGRPAGR